MFNLFFSIDLINGNYNFEHFSLIFKVYIRFYLNLKCQGQFPFEKQNSWLKRHYSI